MRIRTDNFKTLVILDEVHHAGDALSWGEGVREAFQPATRRLALTGTPFRSDINPIPFVTYAPGDDGVPRSLADYTYGYAHALADHVVRPVLFLAYSGEMQWRTRAGDEIAARLGEPLTKDLNAQALRTALDPAGSWIPAVLEAADRRLSEVRRHVPDAGGLVIATDQDSARAYAALLEQIAGEAPTVVLSDEKAASKKIAKFTDVRRPLDGCRPDGVRGRRRAAPGGRRLRDDHLDPAVLRPGRRPVRAGPRARRVGVDLLAVGAEPAGLRLRDGGRARPRARPRRSPTRPTSSPPRTTCSRAPRRVRRRPTTCSAAFEALGSQARFDQVLFDGAEFGHEGEVHVGSEEEMDFLGIPGLLEPDQMRELLRQRQSDAPQDPRHRAGHRRRGLDVRAAGRPAPRAQRPGRRLAPPHRPGPRHHPRRAAQGVRRPGGRRGHRRPAARAHRPAARVGRAAHVVAPESVAISGRQWRHETSADAATAVAPARIAPACRSSVRAGLTVDLSSAERASTRRTGTVVSPADQRPSSSTGCVRATPAAGASSARRAAPGRVRPAALAARHASGRSDGCSGRCGWTRWCSLVGGGVVHWFLPASAARPRRSRPAGRQAAARSSCRCSAWWAAVGLRTARTGHDARHLGVPRRCPCGWLVYTLVRRRRSWTGTPIRFVDVDQHGLGIVLLNCVGISALMLLLAFGAEVAGRVRTWSEPSARHGRAAGSQSRRLSGRPPTARTSGQHPVGDLRRERDHGRGAVDAVVAEHLVDDPLQVGVGAGDHPAHMSPAPVIVNASSTSGISARWAATASWPGALPDLEGEERGDGVAERLGVEVRAPARSPRRRTRACRAGPGRCRGRRRAGGRPRARRCAARRRTGRST